MLNEVGGGLIVPTPSRSPCCWNLASYLATLNPPFQTVSPLSFTLYGSESTRVYNKKLSIMFFLLNYHRLLRRKVLDDL